MATASDAPLRATLIAIADVAAMLSRRETETAREWCDHVARLGHLDAFTLTVDAVIYPDSCLISLLAEGVSVLASHVLEEPTT